jgi:hypothetical protein
MTLPCGASVLHDLTLQSLLVHHDLAEHNCEQLLPAVGGPGGHHVYKAALNRHRTFEMKPGIEEGRVLPRDNAALGLARQRPGVQLRLVRHVHGELVQVVDVVRVGGELVLAEALPGQNDHATHLRTLTQVHHPHRLKQIIRLET